MTPSAFAKLSIRMIAACFLLLIWPHYITTTYRAAAQFVSNGYGLGDLVLPVLIWAAFAAVAILLWIFASSLGRFLLPSNAERELGRNYSEWQDAGLMFIGGGLLLDGLLGLAFRILGNWVYVGGDPDLATFDLGVGFCLLVGLRTIFSVGRRLIRVDLWRTVSAKGGKSRGGSPD